MRSIIICILGVALWVVFSLPEADAYRRYNDGCPSCHGAFTDSISPKGSVFPGDDKHRMHRSSSSMNTECDLCHTSSDGRDPWIGSSDGIPGQVPGLGCIGCHKGPGLRRHHAANAITSCAGCHGSSGTPLAEEDPVPYYDSAYPAYTLATAPCNETASPNVNENWTIGDFVGIDNDGDNLYDTVDPDCVVLPPCEDSDGDGYVVCDGSCEAGLNLCGECDDGDPAVNPETEEACNGVDDNCDGNIDEGFDVGLPCTVEVGICEAAGTYVCTVDGLGTQCDAVPGTPDMEGPPGDATCTDTLDNDCDGKTDGADPDCTDCTDLDGDGFGIDDGFCTPPFDCDDSDPAVNPGVTEACNGVDDNCDGNVDEGFDAGLPCSVGVGICEAAGTYVCTVDGLGTQCNAVPGTPDAEGPPGEASCTDTFDNDCDGKTDGTDPDCIEQPPGSCAGSAEAAVYPPEVEAGGGGLRYSGYCILVTIGIVFLQTFRRRKKEGFRQ